jgi:hypothetical protein
LSWFKYSLTHGGQTGTAGRNCSMKLVQRITDFGPVFRKYGATEAGTELAIHPASPGCWQNQLGSRPRR